MSLEQRVDYTRLPSFTIGQPNEWYEDGYCFYDKKFYLYSDDRHDNHYQVQEVAESLEDFKDYCEDASIEIPESFLTAVS